MVWSYNPIFFEPNCVHTFDAYYKNVRNVGKNLVVPYINFGINYKHQLNPSKDMMYIDMAYLVARDMPFFRVYEKKDPIIGNAQVEEAKFFFGGRNLDDNLYIDMEFESEDVFLLVSKNFKLTKTYWIPLDTPNFRPNMDASIVKSFFDYEFFPKECDVFSE